MGFGRENGRFACVEAATGQLRWEITVEATFTDVVSADVDGDGRAEFVFGTSHGHVYAVGDDQGRPRIVWKKEVEAGVASVTPADVTGDGRLDLIITMRNGDVILLSAK